MAVAAPRAPGCAARDGYCLVKTIDGTSWTWEALAAEYSPMLVAYARSRGIEAAEDLAQDVLLAAARLDDFNGNDAALRSWVFTVAHRQIADRHRRRHRRPEVLVSELVPTPSEAPLPDESVVALEDFRSATDALAVLSERERQVLEMRIIQEASPAEIGRSLGISTGNVSVIQARALGKLRRHLGSRGWTGLGGIIPAIVSSGIMSLDGTANPSLTPGLETAQAGLSTAPLPASSAFASPVTSFVAKIAAVACVAAATATAAAPIAETAPPADDAPPAAVVEEDTSMSTDDVVDGYLAPGPGGPETTPDPTTPNGNEALPSIIGGPALDPDPAVAPVGPLLDGVLDPVAGQIPELVDPLLGSLAEDVVDPLLGSLTADLVDPLVGNLTDKTIESTLDDLSEASNELDLPLPGEPTVADLRDLLP